MTRIALLLLALLCSGYGTNEVAVPVAKAADLSKLTDTKLAETKP